MKQPARRLLLLVAAFLLWGFGLFVTALLFRALRIDRCPPHSFLSRMSIDAAFLSSLPLCGALWSAAGLATGNVPSGPIAFGNGRRALWMAELACVIAVPAVMWIGAGNELCLAPAGIVARANSLAPTVEHRWSDVVGLQTVCATHGFRRRSRHESAHFMFADGTGFWLTTSEYARLRRLLSAMLVGVPYKFAVPDIDETCPDDRMALFGHKP